MTPAQPLRLSSDACGHNTMLFVEVLSPSTRRRDHEEKRQFYLDAGVPEYWIIDPETERLRVVRPGRPAEVVSDEITWAPTGVAESLRFAVRKLFSD